MKVSIHVSLLILLSLASASYANEFDTAGGWQMIRLFHPTQADLVSEKKGKIIIYDGLTDKTVDRALDEHFDRIGALMFIRTVVTDDTGKPLQDPETGELVTEEDGCD